MRRLKSYLTTTSVAACLLLATSGRSTAQEVPEPQQPVAEHKWLDQFVGQWNTHIKATMAPGGPEIECKGTMTSKALGGFWVVTEMKGEMQGQPTSGLLTVGYDPAKKKYVGTWIDSMSHTFWVYSGSVDDSGKKLTLEADGPNIMAEGQTTKYRDAYEFKSADRIILTSAMLDSDGKWITFMSAEITRIDKPVRKP